MGRKRKAADTETPSERLGNRTIHVTKFMDTSALETLGMLEVVRSLLTKVGLEGFMTKQAQTYKRYTLEFLSSLQTQELKGVKMITFRLNRKTHTMTYADLRTAFGWEAMTTTKPAWRPLDSHARPTFWHSITHRAINSNGDQSSSIPHPGLRLVHRFLAMTVFGHGEPSKLNKIEVSYLWAMTPEGVTVPDWADIFVQACLAIQKSKTRKISIGGMVTLIALHLNVKLPPSATALRGSHLYDISALEHLDMIQRTDKADHYHWRYGPSHVPYLKLPRLEGLPYGPTAADFYLAPDPDVAPYLVTPPPVSNDNDADTQQSAPEADATTYWQQEVRDKFEELFDGMDETRRLCQGLDKLFTSLYPDTYQSPSKEYYVSLAARANAREARREARRGSRTRDSEGSTSES